MKQIIVNADDFGINTEVTTAIEREIELGKVSSTTVMANGACLDEVKRYAALHPEVSFGVHLCLSEFDSLTKSNGLKQAGLVNDEGQFNHKAIFSSQNLKEELVRNAIRDELNAQIDVVSSLGFPVSHADSHHHVHTIYPLKDLFTEVLKYRGIDKIRLGGDFRTMRMKLHLSLWLQRNRLNKYYKNQFTTTNDFYSYAEFLDAGCPLKDGMTIELMCHPGHQGKTYLSEIQRMEETALPSDIKLISYNDLH